MNKRAFLALAFLFGGAACGTRITNTVRLDVEFEDAAFDTSLIKTLEIVLDNKNGKMPSGLNRAIRRADTVDGIIVYSESRNMDDDRTDAELVLSTAGNPFVGGRRAWGLDITGKDDTEFSVEARILNNANEVIARATTSFDATGRPIKFENDYKRVVLRVRCEANANCTGGVTVVPNRPTDAGGQPASPVEDAGPVPAEDAGVVAEDAGIVAEDAGIVVEDAGIVAEDAGVVVEDAGTTSVVDAGQESDAGAPTPVDAGPPPDTTAPRVTNITVSPDTVARGQQVIVEFSVDETLIRNPDVVLDTFSMSHLSGTGPSYKYKLTIPSNATGGTKVITIRATDLANNIGVGSSGVTIDTTSGTSDPAFGVSGVRVHSNTAGGNGDDYARAGAFDTNGRLLVVGKSRADAGSTIDRLALWRVTDAGALDTGFQNVGYTTHRGVTDGITVANAIAVAPTGEIYAAGTTADPNGISHVAIWGFFANGYPITSFGQGGVMTFSGTLGTGVANGIALKSQTTAAGGSVLGIYAAGYTISSPGLYDVAVWKVTTSGAPDTSFNGSGALTIPSPVRGTNRATGLVVADAGQLYVVGTSLPSPGEYELAVWSFLPDGGANTAFGTSGARKLTRNPQLTNDQGNAITLVGSNIYVAGMSSNAANQPEAIVWNLTTSGAAVSTFGSNGVWSGTFASPATGTTATTVALDGKGRIVVGGGKLVPRTDEGVRVEGTLWRLTKEGALDTLFNGTGTMALPGATGASNANDAVYDLLVDSANRITVIGGGSNAAGNLDMAVWRVR
ncbi:MAG: hypothetical protein HYY84_08570 [Deltaproteobacteria bacterium]|nr:hypothetical protein [Deltaproteobacteria bacterium]